MGNKVGVSIQDALNDIEVHCPDELQAIYDDLGKDSPHPKGAWYVTEPDMKRNAYFYVESDAYKWRLFFVNQLCNP